VELIVVLAILLALAAMIVGLAPRMQERQKTERGASQLQGWLGIARQWARAARRPTGIQVQARNIVPYSGMYGTDLQYIQQPPDFVVTPSPVPGDPINVHPIQVPQGSLNTVILAQPQSPTANFWGGYGPIQRNLWPVQVGDHIEVNGGGLMHQIGSVEPNSLVLVSPLPQPVYPPGTKQYRIVRLPRALPGEPALQLAQDVVIDLTKSIVPAPNAEGTIDILFAPSGALLAPGINNKIILWVRDVTQDASTPGDQTLIAIYVRTGLVAAYQVAPGADPYLYTRSGSSSGL
jgi:type II secretory pathway pseudopilin PulG